MTPTTLELTRIDKAAGTFPQAGQGQIYSPLPDKTEDSRVTGHAVQTILAEPKELYDFWHNVSEIPRWQEHVVSVTPIDATTSHWVMGDPDDKDGKRIEFDSQLTEDVPGQRISWHSITPEIEQGGTVTFEPAPPGRGTRVTLIQTAKVPLGAVGNAVAGVVKRGPKQTIIEDLRHFKQIMETGEIPSVAGQPHGPRGIAGGIKEWLYGETNPTPPGTSDQP